MREDLLPTTLDGKIAKVVEECGEVLHVIGKYGRHGWKPTDPKTGIQYNNLHDLGNELQDLNSSICVLLDELIENYN
jgi:NTP pyrophosphatase (non-canonical NTP hydrolase)